MARWNPERRLLDHEHTHFWRHQLVEVDEPNLMRNIFPYTEVARIDFDYKFVMPNPAEQMLITDTTFRDGQQARPPYSVRQMVEIFDMLHKLSGPKGIIRQTEFFLYSAKDKEAVERCRERGYLYPEITGWIRAHAADLQLVKDMGLGETGILTSVSDYHIFMKLNRSRGQALESYLNIVKAALELGIVPRCHFEDITRADVYGFCVPFAIELMKLREQSGIDIKIRLCDTMGYGVPYPGAALPRSVPKLVRSMIEDAGVPGHLMEWHGHNDFHKVFINGVTAWLYGCGAVNGTLLGFGERTGNSPIEALLMEYISLAGHQRRHRHHGDHRHRPVFRAGTALPHSAELSLCGGQLQCHQRRHSRRRHAKIRGDLQSLRHHQDPQAPPHHHHHRQVGQGRHCPLDQLPPGAHGGRPGGQGASRGGENSQAHHGNVRRGAGHLHFQ
jgi:citrate (Re)-synthase